MPARFIVKAGDALDLLKRLPGGVVDLVVTSPPYADARKSTYGGIAPDEYVEWFLPRAAELYRVLRPTGSFILNIKEGVVDGQRHRYVSELDLALRAQGWLMTDHGIWHKKNGMPGRWPNRLRDAWEHLYQLNKSRAFVMFQDAVAMPPAASTAHRKRSPLTTTGSHYVSATGSGARLKVANWCDRDTADATNVLHLSAETTNQHHPAVFPVTLPEFFIKLFTEQGDLVLDPFCGVGSTGVAARTLDRHFIGIDLLEEYVTLANQRISATPPTLKD